MKSMLDRHKAQVLLQAGHTHKEVVEHTRIGLRTTWRIGHEPPVKDLDDRAERKKRRIGRPIKTMAFRKPVEDMLRSAPDLMTLELFRRARELGYAGGKSAFFELVKGLRPSDVPYTMRFEGIPGEFTQHDFGQVDVVFLDGSEKRIHFFASRLKWSRYAEVAIVPDERVETLVRTIAAHFASMGGIPLLAVFDRPRTVALSWDHSGKVTEWNRVFASAMFELGVGVDVDVECGPSVHLSPKHFKYSRAQSRGVTFDARHGKFPTLRQTQRYGIAEERTALRYGSLPGNYKNNHNRALSLDPPAGGGFPPHFPKA
ncbi:MAG: hypothetical protein FJ149_13110, partial [Euryarchaeota archaeon]|nr:hypothetical protein [Euryarchaeota archaeon]